jgi:hypothetical protein
VECAWPAMVSAVGALVDMVPNAIVTDAQRIASIICSDMAQGLPSFRTERKPAATQPQGRSTSSASSQSALFSVREPHGARK